MTMQPLPRTTRLFDMIRMRGYDGGIAILRCHVAAVRPVPRGEVYLRVERLIGEQAQVDWAHVESLAVAGGARPLRAFAMMLAYSRVMRAELVFDLTVESIRRSLSTSTWMVSGPLGMVAPSGFVVAASSLLPLAASASPLSGPSGAAAPGSEVNAPLHAATR